ncbi:MAG: DUF6569 family protein, partial [Aquiluna sp.]
MNQTPTISLPDLHVGHGYRYGALTWFPVWTSEPERPRRYRTDVDLLGVSELGNAHVPTLEVSNPTDDPIIVFEGSVFEGGFQHRNLTRTALIPARASSRVPVVCVEQNRWGGESRRHHIGGRVAPSRVRAASRGIIRSEGGSVLRQRSDQTRVWDEVRGYQSRHNMDSATQSMIELDDAVSRREEPMPEVQPLPGQRGVIVAAAGQPMALELFDHPDTLAEKLTEILHGFRLDVTGLTYIETPSRRAIRFAERTRQLGLERNLLDELPGVLRSPKNQYVAT